jgi:hypothetical protein
LAQVAKTSKNTWKQFERRVASFFGGRRVPLSGGNSGHTRADVMGADGLFVEAKLRAKSALWSLLDKTKPLAKKEGKVAVLAIGRKHSPGFIICVHSDDFEEFIIEYASNNLHKFSVFIQREVY